MTRTTLTFTFLTILFLATGHIVYGQDKAITTTYTNPTNAYYDRAAHSKDTFFASKINEITLKADSTFEFWSRPHMSCLTWHVYKGTWRKDKDTLFFFDNYEVLENDTKATYKKDSRQDFIISFKTDKGSHLKNRTIKVQYEYDYDAHLDNPEKIFILNSDNALVIPFKEISNLDKLASIRVEYFLVLDFTERRDNYLTQNEFANKRQDEIPNIINVEFVEKPQKEIVYRTIKGVIQNDKLIIVSATKTKTNLTDYHREIEFENSYSVNR